MQVVLVAGLLFELVKLLVSLLLLLLYQNVSLGFEAGTAFLDGLACWLCLGDEGLGLLPLLSHRVHQGPVILLRLFLVRGVLEVIELFEGVGHVLLLRSA